MKRKLPGFSLVLLIVLGSALTEVSLDKLRGYLRFLSGGMIFRKLEFLRVNRPDDFFSMIAYFLMLLVFCIAVIRVVLWVLGFFVQRPYTPSTRSSTAERVVTDTEDKYLRQLKGFLDSGLIERKEYEALVRRYMMNL